MDRGKKSLQEIVGEWTTVHKKSNKGKAVSNSKKGFVPAQIPFYPNQGYYVSYPMEDRDEESVKLLKKIADMEIEEFPLHIIEKIKNTWETWNSPPRLSLDSLYLDEIEEMNLNNMQED
ncbi:hypothetical protein Gotur_016369 [Gossypium turneri]